MLLDEGAYDDALKQVSSSAAAELSVPFQASFADRRGDIHIAENKLDDARREYAAALALLESRADSRGYANVVQLKLDGLMGGVVASAAPAPTDARCRPGSEGAGSQAMMFASRRTSGVVVASSARCRSGGCAWWEDTYIFQTAPKNRPTPLTELKPTLAVRPLWNASVGKAGRYFFSPALIGPDVVAAGGKGVVERRILATGVVVWRTDLDVPLAAGVGSDGNTSAVVTETGDIIALDGRGKPQWRVPTNTEVLSAPVVGQGLVVVRTTDNRVHRVRRRDRSTALGVPAHHAAADPADQSPAW